MSKMTTMSALLLALTLAIAGCGNEAPGEIASTPAESGGPSSGAASSAGDPHSGRPDATPASGSAAAPNAPTGRDAAPDKQNEPADDGANKTTGKTADKSQPVNQGNDASGKDKEMQVVAKPESITALVNKQNALPDNYKPSDLVYPDVPFLFKEKIEKRMLRKEAAEALEKLFAAAKEDGVALAGVSAYRSRATQKALFERYVKKDGEAKARTYSAVPGTSEHETGLAIDVSGSDGKCAASDCFADTKEAEWLAEHAPEYGFIIRYPKGKENITGYQYEPWHLRYVGVEIAKEIAAKGITLEEYFDAVPVSQP